MDRADTDRMIGAAPVVRQAAMGLRRVRLRRGMTQDDLRRAVGALGRWSPSRTTVVRHEAGAPLTLHQLAAYAEALGCSAAELMLAGL